MNGAEIGKGGEAAAIIVGGGPAGLFLAARLGALLAAARDGGGAAGVSPTGDRGILVLEKMAAPGRKLLASGAGQCNISHAGPIGDFLPRFGEAGRFLKKALYAFSNDDLAGWLGERGLALEEEEGGKLFPASRKAQDVLRILLEECGGRDVAILKGARVSSAARDREGGFIVETQGADGVGPVFSSPLLAIATGGRSYPGTGSSGDGYALARALGHAIVPPRPALAPIALCDTALCSLAGLSFEGLAFAVRRGGRKIREERGDLLVTHEGLSGPGILDASRGLRRGDLLELDFSGLGLEAFREAFASRVAASPRAFARTVLAEACSPAARPQATGLPRRLAELILSLAGVDADTRCAELRREPREAMARMAAAFPAEIASLAGFERAMATAGGVSLGEVDPATMGSRIVDGLYFAGEVLDYDGDTGGFNLQAAFSTADAAARGMSSRATADQTASGSGAR